jgi:hypothetical protein
MTTAEKINGIPISGEYEEIIFDLPEPWREQNWHYVKFTKTNGEEWCGVFREKDRTNFLVSDLPENGIALIVSGGHGYLIDINSKTKIKDIKTEPILEVYADKTSETFFISRSWDCWYLDKDLQEFEIKMPIDCDGIFFKERIEQKLMIEFEEIGADLTKNNDYYIDLNEKKTKKNAV